MDASDNDVAKRMIDLLKIIRPSLPAQADYTANEKAYLYDRARQLLYDESGTVRPLSARLPKLSAIILIGALSAMSWAVVVLIIVAIR